MAKQTIDQTPKSLLVEGVTQAQLDAWKQEHGAVYTVSVTTEDGDVITGYYKKPTRDILAIVVNMQYDKKVYEAREFLAKNTFLGGNAKIQNNFDCRLSAETRLWAVQNFLSAVGTKY